jgi:16S rRNA (cytosine967-C5)-methyltransferase
LTEPLSRSGLEAEVAQGDTLSWEPEAPADLILLDAPCSATGIFRRHPDVLYRSGPRQIAEMAEVQQAMLERAAPWVKPSGILIYATCSLEPAEGEEQITAFLSTHSDFQIVAPSSSELPEGIIANGEGAIRTLPGMLEAEGGLDGFFIARLRRAL